MTSKDVDSHGSYVQRGRLKGKRAFERILSNSSRCLLNLYWYMLSVLEYERSTNAAILILK